MDISKTQKIYNDIDWVINSSMLDKYKTIEDIFTSLCGRDDEISIFEYAVNVLISLDKRRFHRNLERYIGIFCGNAQMVTVLLNKQAEEERDRKRYEIFKLKWLIEHGYGLEDVLKEVGWYLQDNFYNISIWNAVDLFERYGFKGGMIYPCFEEWIDNEGKAT